MTRPNPDWMDRDCIDCEFCDGHYCREGPPTEHHTDRDDAGFKNELAEYPLVVDWVFYSGKACSRFKEILSN